MRARKRGHIVNVSSIGVQTSPPRFSAYVASKAALDAFTRVVGSETIGDRVTFTTIHMPLVRTPMIAPTKIYDSFPTISPDEAADLICEAIRAKPKQINTRLGTFGEVAYALAPKAVDQLLHLAYRVFPDSAAARGEVGGDEQVLDRAARAGAPDARRALVERRRCPALAVAGRDGPGGRLPRTARQGGAGALRGSRRREPRRLRRTAMPAHRRAPRSGRPAGGAARARPRCAR